MLSYIAYRVLQFVPLLLMISVLTFAIIELPPGDYLTMHIYQLEQAGTRVSEAEIARLKDEGSWEEDEDEKYHLEVRGPFAIPLDAAAQKGRVTIRKDDLKAMCDLLTEASTVTQTIAQADTLDEARALARGICKPLSYWEASPEEATRTKQHADGHSDVI